LFTCSRAYSMTSRGPELRRRRTCRRRVLLRHLGQRLRDQRHLLVEATSSQSACVVRRYPVQRDVLMPQVMAHRWGARWSAREASHTPTERLLLRHPSHGPGSEQADAGHNVVDKWGCDAMHRRTVATFRSHEDTYVLFPTGPLRVHGQPSENDTVGGLVDETQVVPAK
jgi:hypothetical protein